MSNYVQKTLFTKSAYSSLINTNDFKCGGSKCSCQFKEPRTSYDKAQIMQNCNFNPNNGQVNSFDPNSFMYLGV